jgi:hypothetical protein
MSSGRFSSNPALPPRISVSQPGRTGLARYVLRSRHACNSGEGFAGILLEPLLSGCPLSFVEECEEYWIAVYSDGVLNVPNSTRRGKGKNQYIGT